MDRHGFSANKADINLPQDLCVSADKLKNDAEKQRAAHIENQKEKVDIGLAVDGRESQL